MTDLSRRELLGAALVLPLARGWSPVPQPVARDVDVIRRAPGRVVTTDGHETDSVVLEREWTGDECRSRVVNRGRAPVRIREVVLFDATLEFPPSTAFYGESFQMLSQSGGTLGAPKDLGSYTDAKHYRIPVAEGSQTCFGAITLSPPNGRALGVGFTSTRRFAGLFRLFPPASLQVVVDTEQLTLAPGDAWDLESLVVISGASRDAVLGRIGDRLARNHPRLPFAAPPAGWCSWYCFGPRVTAQNILDNLEVIEKQIPSLTYVQIDDGYQAAMGDWLDTGAAFGGDVRKVLEAIRARGFQPALWVAPFVAEAQSRVFAQHPGWFVKDADGSPLRSDKVTFGGWRRGPWYALDGTHPEVQAHFEHTFRTMREWGVTYFKLDANFWGAMHGGRFHDPQATRIEAYRRGMQAIQRGAGDSFLLGCNHPIWPSAGLIHGSRSSNDIKRDWDHIKTTAQQNLLRNWQNGRLWWNDPDAVVLTGDLPENEFAFHAIAIYASGGMVLSGDDLTTIAPPRLAMLRKLVPPRGAAAVFEDESLRIGTMAVGDKRMLCLFNWGDEPQTFSTRLTRAARVRDAWSGELIGRFERTTPVIIRDMPPRSARLLECVNA